MSILNGKEVMLLGLKGDSCFVRFSAYADGSNFTEEPEGQQYFVGFATAQTAPTDKSKYKWIYFGGGGEGGAGGVSPIVDVTQIEGGHRVTITDALGTESFVIMDGTDGKDGKDGKDGRNGTNGTNGTNGKDGYTPVKGTDYWTSADKEEIVSDVISALGIYNGESEDV